MIGFFHATGLGGIEEDQGKVSFIVTLCPDNAVVTTTKREADYIRLYCIILSLLCRGTSRRRWR